MLKTVHLSVKAYYKCGQDVPFMSATQLTSNGILRISAIFLILIIILMTLRQGNRRNRYQFHVDM